MFRRNLSDAGPFLGERGQTAANRHREVISGLKDLAWFCVRTG